MRKIALALAWVGFLLVTLLSSRVYSAVAIEEQANPTLAIISRPGGSIIVESASINGGQPVVVEGGQQKNWTVPNRTRVKVTATDFAPGLSFMGWTGTLNGNPSNPGTFTVDSNTTIAGYFSAGDAPNTLFVNLQSPGNTTYTKDSVLVILNIVSPHSSWQLTSVYGLTAYVDGATLNETVLHWNTNPSNPGTTYNAILTLSGLADGQHSMFALAKASFDAPTGMPVGDLDPAPGSGVSDLVHFTVDATPPQISILSPQAQKFNTPEVRLGFTSNKLGSQFAYSLDGKDNVTVSGNMTLTGLTVGAHNITVYAWDSFGRAGASETVNFDVIEEAEPSPTALIIVVVLTLSVAVVGVGLLVYLRKGKRGQHT